MSIVLSHDYEAKLKSAQPTFLKPIVVAGPKGSLGGERVVTPGLTIPPINTSINWDSLTPFTVSPETGLAAISTPIPAKFNWRDDAGDKKDLIVTPENQMLCGSCWAFATASVISDIFVVSGSC